MAQLLHQFFTGNEPMQLLLQILFDINGCCRPGEGEGFYTASGAKLQFVPNSGQCWGSYNLCQSLFEHVLCSNA